MASKKVKKRQAKKASRRSGTPRPKAKKSKARRRDEGTRVRPGRKPSGKTKLQSILNDRNMTHRDLEDETRVTGDKVAVAQMLICRYATGVRAPSGRNAKRIVAALGYEHIPEVFPKWPDAECPKDD